MSDFFFVGLNYSSDKIFITSKKFKCISTKHLGKNLIWQYISSDKIIRRTYFSPPPKNLSDIFLRDKVTPILFTWQKHLSLEMQSNTKYN